MGNKLQILGADGQPLSTQEVENIDQVMNGLPFVNKVDAIIAGLQQSNAILVDGATGSGKSTGLPALARDFCQQEMGIKDPLIRVIQPRVAAATGLASRISLEQQIRHGDTSWALGNKVGYLTGRGKLASPNANILLETSGYELRRQMGGGEAPDVLILDEYHTDDIFIQLLSHITREQLLNTRSQMKVIITSATINRLKTLQYFEPVDANMPIVSIEGRTFPIESYSIAHSDFSGVVDKILVDGGHTLMFQPGKKEIDDTIQFLQQRAGAHVKIFPFHGDMSIEEQREVVHYKPGVNEQVLIVATNSAEESLTISYLKYLVDFGDVKISSTNYNGVERLDIHKSSQASVDQRKGRVGRTQPGEAYLVEEKNGMTSREKFTPAPITHSTLEDEILLLAQGGIHFSREAIRQEELGRKMLPDSPDEKLVRLSYDRLFKYGAINEEGEITSMGKKMLQFPVSACGSRILCESIDRGVPNDIVDIVSIMEHNGFLSMEGDLESHYSKSARTREKSDLLFLLKIFRDITSKNLNEKTFNFFVFECGLEGCKDYNKYLKSGKMFYELYDSKSLDTFGINKRSLQKITETTGEVKDRMSSNGIDLSDTGDLDDKIISLLSGNLDSIYHYDSQKKGFVNHVNADKTVFAKSKQSGVNERVSDGLYIGKPFILGGKGTEDSDMNILTMITHIESHHLSVFQDILSQRYSGYSSFKGRLLGVYKNLLAYSNTLAEKISADSTQNNPDNGKRSKTSKGKNDFAREDLSTYLTRKLTEEYVKGLNDIGNESKNFSGYCNLIIFLKELDSERKIHLRAIFKQQEAAVERKGELYKQRDFMKDFVDRVENIPQNCDEKVPFMNLPSLRPGDLLISDPVIASFGFRSTIHSLRSHYQTIKLYARKSDLKSKKIRFMSNLFSADNRKYRTAQNNVSALKIDLREQQKNINVEIENAHQRKLNGQRVNSQRVNSLRRKQKHIERLVQEIEKFSEMITNMRTNIDSIDFKEVLFRVRKSNRNIYTKKYLLSIFLDQVCNGDVMLSTSQPEQKLQAKMKLYLSESLSQEEIQSASYIMKSFAAGDINNRKALLNRMGRFAEKVKSGIPQIQDQIEENQTEIDRLGNEGITPIIQNIELILGGLYEEEEDIENVGTKIRKFAKSILSASVNTIDNKLVDFILNLPQEQRKDYGVLFGEIDNYRHKIDLLGSAEYQTVIPQEYKTSQMGTDEFQSMIAKIKGINAEIQTLGCAIANQLKDLPEDNKINTYIQKLPSDPDS